MRNTFLELNSKEHNPDFCFVGVECCTADYLLGVQDAADNVRKLSYRYANADKSAFPLKVYNPDEGYILKEIIAYDIGNVKANLNELEKKLTSVDFDDCIPIFVGGDHGVTYPIVKSISQKYDNIVIVQFDSHSDYIAEYDEYPHGSVMNEISKLERVEKIIHFGLRGNLNSKPAIEKSIQDGNLVVSYKDISSKLLEVLNNVKDKKIYISFDIDFLNPSVAPATNCPEPGGPSYEETLEYLKSIICFSKDIVGIDFVEYNPRCEGSTTTGLVVVNLIMECMHYIKSKELTKRREEL